MTGWLKMHRQMLNSPIFNNEKLFKIFMYCLMKASHKEHKQIVGQQVIELKSGQFIFGRKKASEELNMNESTVWRYIKMLNDVESINVKSNNKFSVITIVNWGLYQHDGDETDNKRTTDEQQKNNKRTTDEQQMNTNKNVKNVKNDKNDNNNVGNTLDILQNQKINPDHNPNKNMQLRDLHIQLGDDELIKAATIAKERNSPNVGYVLGVLKNRVKELEKEKSKPTESDVADFLKDL